MLVTEQYRIDSRTIESLVQSIKDKTIAIPAIQRPFVWGPQKVCDLIDSFYHAYPVGYIISWENTRVRMKHRKLSSQKMTIIDGQQRLCAIMTAMLGEYVIDKKFREIRIKISFNPDKQIFQVANPDRSFGPEWIDDIADFFTGKKRTYSHTKQYLANNPNMDERKIEDNLEVLASMKYNTIGVVTLDEGMKLRTVAEVFQRINTKGDKLTATDLVMSSMAAAVGSNGHNMRRCIEYFVRFLSQAKEHTNINVEQEFSKTEYYKAIQWTRRGNSTHEPYIPSINDIIRITATAGFKLANINRLVDKLSGMSGNAIPDSKLKIIDKTYVTLGKIILSLVSESNFKDFSLILRSVGFTNSSIVHGGHNSLNFAYSMFLTFKDSYDANNIADFERLIKKWFIFSFLTRRYSSAGTVMGEDINKMENQDMASFVENTIRDLLTEGYWNTTLPRQVIDTVSPQPTFMLFMAIHIANSDKGFLSKNKAVTDLIDVRSNRHHIFPKKHLKDEKKNKNQINQIANLVIMDPSINRKIGAKAPETYFSELVEQCNGGKKMYGDITDLDELKENFAQHCIPFPLGELSYEEFLQERRKLMAVKIRHYFENL